MHRRSLLAAGGCLLAGCGAPFDAATPSPASFDGFDDGADRVVVAAGGGDPPVRLAAAGETFRYDPRGGRPEPFALTLSNGSGGRVTVAPDAWRLYRRTADGWAPRHDPGDGGRTVVLGAAGRYRWFLTPGSTPSPETKYSTDVLVPLDAGRHAFSVTVEVGERAVECVARFDVAVA